MLIRRLLCSLALGLCLSVAGCATTGTSTDYQANERLVQTLGVPTAQQRLKETLSRSINPQVVETEVTEEFFRYRFKQAIAGFQTGAVLENKVDFLNAARVQTAGNNVVNIFTSANHLIAQFVFGNDQDVHTFADLVVSFRARRAQ